jgi:hypothetical protein
VCRTGEADLMRGFQGLNVFVHMDNAAVVDSGA